MGLRRQLAVLSVAVALSLVFSAGAGVAARAPIRITHVDLRDYPTIRLTVVTSTPRLVPPRVTENGVAPAGLQAENLADQASIVLTIDRSQSMHGETLVRALTDSRSFLDSKPNSYRVSVVTFASQPLLLSQPSTSTTDADAALRSIAVDPQTGTTMYDAIVLAARTLDAESYAGRVIVLITDGQETTSKATLRQAVDAARRAHAIIYPIAIKDSTYTPAPLHALASDTGGRMTVAAPGRSLAGAYALIAAELRRTWELSYYTAARPGAEVDLAAQTPGGAQTDSNVAIPEATGPPIAGSGLPLSEIAIALAALLVGAIVLGLAARGIRPSRFDRW
jgi:VWFA-related protein